MAQTTKKIDLTKKDKDARKQFCEQFVGKPISYLKRFFGVILDEKTFDARLSPEGRLYEQRRRVRGGYTKKGQVLQRPGTKNAPSRQKKSKVNILGGMCGDKMVLWQDLKGPTTSKSFCCNALARSFKNNKTKKMSMDNARPHKSKFTQRFLEKEKSGSSIGPSKVLI